MWSRKKTKTGLAVCEPSANDNRNSSKNWLRFFGVYLWKRDTTVSKMEIVVKGGGVERFLNRLISTASAPSDN